MIGRLARTVGAAIDARGAARAAGAEQAAAAAWIAQNVLAARGVHVTVELAGGRPDAGGVVGVRAGDLAGLLAAIATVPMCVDAASLPHRWRFALGALGIPTAPAAPAPGRVGVLVPPRRHRPLPSIANVRVAATPGGYRVRVTAPRRALLAAA